MGKVDLVVDELRDRVTITKSCSVDEFKDLIFEIFINEFLGKDLTFITIDPNETSLGLEYGEQIKLTVRKRNFLITSIKAVSEEIIRTLLLVDHEFWVGLLWICEGGLSGTEVFEDLIVAYYFKYSNYPVEFIRCYDSNIIEWYFPQNGLNHFCSKFDHNA